MLKFIAILIPALLIADVPNTPLRATLEHVEGKWLDNSQGYTTLEAFVATTTPDFVPFLDLKGHYFNNSKFAANLGGGIRTFICEDKVFGVNLYYDYRKDNWDNYHHRLGAGFELLTECCDVRLNGYFPIGNRTSHSVLYDFIDEDFVWVFNYYRQSTLGGDIEFGKWICPLSVWSYGEWYTALGAYYIETDEPEQNTWGFQARIETELSDCLSVQFKFGYDKIYHNSFQIYITFDHIFSLFRDKYCVSDIIYQPVERMDIITLGRKGSCWD